MFLCKQNVVILLFYFHPTLNALISRVWNADIGVSALRKRRIMVSETIPNSDVGMKSKVRAICQSSIYNFEVGAL